MQSSVEFFVSSSVPWDSSSGTKVSTILGKSKNFQNVAVQASYIGFGSSAVSFVCFENDAILWRII